ncbi:hypothetical protein GGI02_003238 [Coemansia sp. RSA 2322]|nr:hypothetical protein GGI02_003238 [Coemansia sp. RSA 2322]
MPCFNELQTVLRLFYSRPSTAFGQPKKKLRRVVSTSNVLMGEARGPASALGVHGQNMSQLGNSDLASERKHDLEAAPEHQAKRCRRVVSELPPKSLSSLLDFGCAESSLSFSSTTTIPFWHFASHEQSLGGMAASDQSPALDMSLRQATPLHMRVPLLLPTFDLPEQYCSSIYELPAGVPHGMSAAALTATTMAAMAGFEEALSSPMMATAERLPVAASFHGSTFGSAMPRFAPSFPGCITQPHCPDMMSAFAAAAASPACSPCDTAYTFGRAVDIAAAAATTTSVAAVTEECNRALVDAFEKYYTESPLDAAQDVHFSFCEWSDAGVEDGAACNGAPATTAGQASSCNRSAQPAAAACRPASTAPVQHTTCPSAINELGLSGSNVLSYRPGKMIAISNPARSDSVEPGDISLSPARVLSAHSATDSTTDASNTGSRVEDYLPFDVQGRRSGGARTSKAAKDIRSSPSCALSMHSTSRASDATLAARGSSGGPVTKGQADSGIANSLCQHEAAEVPGFGSSSPVIDWLRTLNSMLDSQDIDPRLFVDGTCSALPTSEDIDGHAWLSILAQQHTSAE